MPGRWSACRSTSAGGQLVLGLLHLSTEARRDRAPAPLAAEQIRKCWGWKSTGWGEFGGVQGRDEACAEAVRGHTLRLGKVRLGEAEVRVSDATGQPLVTERRWGRGGITYVNAAGYPGAELLTLLYTRLLGQIGAWAAAEETARRERGRRRQARFI